MDKTLPIIVIALLVLLVLLAMTTLARGFVLAVRRRGPRQPTAYIPDANPPAPVYRSRGVVAVAAGVLAWSAVHVALVVLWAMTGAVVPRAAAFVSAAIYVSFAAVAAAAGAIGLLNDSPHGRRMVAWGEFLLGVAAFGAAAVLVIVPTYEPAPQQLREIGYALAAAMLLHLVVDGVLGFAAQRAGGGNTAAQTVDRAGPWQ